MTKFIPYPFYHDDVPIDISFVFENEKPAGKHGFLKTQGRNFVFEDGTRATFWGTNFNGAGCFPSHAYAETLARRLAQIGINLVRFHQLDAEWHTPNLFAFSKGKRQTGASFDPESMDRLDYLIYCLKKEGIYLYMDMFTYRRFKSDEGAETAVHLSDAAKPYCVFDDTLIELQKDLCTRLWTHVNPYTGLCYADDPAFVLAEIANETDLFSAPNPVTIEPYATRFREKLSVWLKKNGIQKEASEFDITDRTDEVLVDFKIELQETYYKTMLTHMREIGIKIPITGNNWVASPGNLKTQLVTDFYDDHAYHYDWRWREFEKHCANTSITQERKTFLNACTFATDKNKPTFISEWDMPWPNEYRAESPLFCAAVGNLQGWSGFAIHTYSYTTKLERMQMLGKEFFTEKIGNVPYRQGVFSAWNDPAKFGLFYHAALITRRGDVKPAKNIIPFCHVSSTEFNEMTSIENLERSALICDNAKYAPKSTEGIQEADEVLSDTGELYRSWKKKYGYINADRTKCAYGFLGRNGILSLSGVTIDCETDFATIALSSLTDAPVVNSDTILLTAVGRAENTGFKAEGDLMLDIGTPPVQIEVIKAKISIETPVEGVRVWAVSPEGYYIGTVPTEYENGTLFFEIGNVSRSMYYLIIKE